MRYSRSPADGQMITLDDLCEFVAEMRGYRNLPGNTVIRVAGYPEIDLTDGPRCVRITADPDSTPTPTPTPTHEDTDHL